MPDDYQTRKKKEDKLNSDVAQAVSGKTRVYPSTLQMDEGDLKEIKDWKVGEKYKVEMEIKCVGLSSKGEFAPYDDSDKDKVHGRFEIVKVETD